MKAFWDFKNLKLHISKHILGITGDEYYKSNYFNIERTLWSKLLKDNYNYFCDEFILINNPNLDERINVVKLDNINIGFQDNLTNVYRNLSIEIVNSKNIQEFKSKSNDGKLHYVKMRKDFLSVYYDYSSNCDKVYCISMYFCLSNIERDNVATFIVCGFSKNIKFTPKRGILKFESINESFETNNKKIVAFFKRCFSHNSNTPSYKSFDNIYQQIKSILLKYAKITDRGSNYNLTNGLLEDNLIHCLTRKSPKETKIILFHYLDILKQNASSVSDEVLLFLLLCSIGFCPDLFDKFLEYIRLRDYPQLVFSFLERLISIENF